MILYSFQDWPVIAKAFGESGEYTPSLAAAEADCIRENGDDGWWESSLEPAYRWMIGGDGVRRIDAAVTGCGALLDVGAMGRRA
ncbi:hypothetical protein [Bifidobacterium felsineum]|uniref:hypothetical protein n=1 Tax=Bifidobacterium felsineum TaxID=2045440 RepID=UPI001BDD499C|nr:hypothetical protein [Bifidobacterium felsineum]MBT1164630.1 hypothetical protein [Bifidobacterium felsineum]